MGRPLPTAFSLATAGPAAPLPAVKIELLEITQVVQDTANSVPLIAGKPTVLRCYLSIPPGSLVSVRGEVTVQAADGNQYTVPSSNACALNPLPAAGVRPLRENVDLSLNFLIPTPALIAGQATFTLKSVSTNTGQALQIDTSGHGPVNIAFLAMPPLRVKLFAIRYKSGTPPVSYEPSERDFQLTLSWLRRVYPVADLVATRLIVDSDKDWPFECGDVNLQLAAIRRQDMSAGGDPRTHYFGLVSDANGVNFMRGCAADVPDHPAPDTVASGPAGSNSWNWDNDGSYADWYTGHELGHTFGRAHPGFCNGNSADDANFPFPYGFISDPAGSFIGFDVGDPTLGLPSVALPGLTWTDVMTYCERQWMCSYTYTGIRQRLVDENAALGPVLPQANVALQAAVPVDPAQTSGA